MNLTTEQKNKQEGLTAYDFHGTLNTGIKPEPDSVIISGAITKKDIELYLKKIGVDMPIYTYPENSKLTVGEWKGQKAMELGVTRFYDDSDEDIEGIQSEYPKIEIVKVPRYHWVTLSMGWDGMPIAYHLQEEKADSVVGHVGSKKELGQEDDEESEDKKKRLSQYDGMIKKYPARKLVDALKKVDNKDDYFIFCDQNNLYPYAEELLKAGFTKGLFPLKDDFEFEKDRERAMDFVEENYPDVKIIPYQIAKTVEEAKNMVEESEVPMVLQSKGDFVSTICPPDDLEMNKKQIMDALDKNAADYGKGEIVLKEKLIKPIEITPQIVFWNGQPVYTTLDIETKNIGDGENNGNQVGCGSNLIVKTSMEEKLNKIAFPPKVFHMAKKRTGFFVWDISLYVTPKGIFFGEFCSNRLGYDASFTEMSMSGGVLAYFSSIMRGENPIQEKFGFAVRAFNLNKQENTEVSVEKDSEAWLYEVKKKDDKILSVGNCWDLGVITGTGDTPRESLDDCYSNYDSFSFKEKYARTKNDSLSEFPTSIAERYSMTVGTYFEGPEWDGNTDTRSMVDDRADLKAAEMGKDHEREMKELKKSHEDDMDSIRSEIKKILNG